MRNLPEMADKIPETWLLKLTETQAKQEHWQEALVSARSLSLRNRDGTVEYWLALVHSKLDQLPQAKKSCKKSISLRRKNPPSPEACDDSIRLMMTILIQLRENAELEFYRSLLTPSAQSTNQGSEMTGPLGRPGLKLQSHPLLLKPAEKPNKEEFPATAVDDSVGLKADKKLIRKYGLDIGPDGISLEGTNGQIALAIIDAFQLDNWELARVIFRDERAYNMNTIATFYGPNEVVALERAVLEGKLGFVRLLLKYGALPATSTVVAACHYSSSAVDCLEEKLAIATLLIGHGAPLNYANIWEQNPLGAAVENGCEALVKLFLHRGADVNEGSPSRNHLYICCQVKAQNIEILKALLDAGADLEANNGCVTALHKAVSVGHVEFVRELLRRGANRRAKDNDGKKPINYCNNKEIKRMLKA